MMLACGRNQQERVVLVRKKRSATECKESVLFDQSCSGHRLFKRVVEELRRRPQTQRARLALLERQAPRSNHRLGHRAH